MSRFMRARDNEIVNIDHIIRTKLLHIQSAKDKLVLRLSDGYEITVDDKYRDQFIKKLLTNESDQSTIKVNRGSNHPEKGKK